MVAQGKAGRESVGSIVNISSDAGRAGSIGQINYAAAKSGLLGMTMSTAKEWSKFGLRTNSVCFGVVETDMTETIRGDKFRDGILARIPMGRWATPEEAVKRLYVSCSRMPRLTSPASTLQWTAAFTSPSNHLRGMIGLACFGEPHQKPRSLFPALRGIPIVKIHCDVFAGVDGRMPSKRCIP